MPVSVIFLISLRYRKLARQFVDRLERDILPQAQCQREARAAPDLALQRDIAPHQLRQVARHVQANANAFGVGREGIEANPVEAVKHGLLLIDRNAHAGIPDRDVEQVFLAAENLDPDAATIAGELEGSDLSGADMTATDLSNAVLAGVDMTTATLHQTIMNNVMTDNPVGIPMSDLDPPAREQLEQHVRFIETDGAAGAPADLSGVDMRPLERMAHLNLAALRARKTTFYGLDMCGVKLQGAQLEGADFRTSNLESADLRGANLSGANFSGAILRDCNMGPLVIDELRRLPTQLVEANLQRADLRGADLAQAVLDRADLSGARLDGADLTGASMAMIRDDATDPDAR